MTPAKREFYFEEFKALRKEIEQRIAESGKIFNATVIWIGVIYAWLFKDGIVLLESTNNSSWGYQVALFMPVWISIWGAFRIGENEYKIKMLGDYIRNIENLLEVTGWEHRPGDRKLWQGFLICACLPVMPIAITILAYILR